MNVKNLVFAPSLADVSISLGVSNVFVLEDLNWIHLGLIVWMLMNVLMIQNVQKDVRTL